MKKISSILTLMLLFGLSSAFAEDVSVKVSSARSAVVSAIDSSANPELTGTVKGSLDIKQGKGGLNADLTIKKASELQGAEAEVYASVTGKAIEAIGFLSGKIPADSPEALKSLSANLESVTLKDNSGGHFDINLEVPANPADVPKASGSAKLKSDSKKIESSLNFEVSGEAVKASDIPFSKLEIAISEKENKTTISLLVATAKDSQLASQLKSLPTVAPMLEAKLKEMQVKYEKLSFPEPTIAGDVATAKAELTLLEIRSNLKPLLGMLAMQMQGVPEAQKALEEMIEGRLDSLKVNLDVVNDSVKGVIEFNASQLDHFWNGYLTLLPGLQALSNAQMVADAGDFAPIMKAWLDINTEKTIASVKLLVESKLTVEGEANFSLDVKAAESTTPTPDAAKADSAMGLASFSASGKFLAANYLDYVAKAKQAGLPLSENAVARVSLDLKDQNTIEGNAYLYADGNIVDFYKDIMVQAAKEAKSPEEVQKALADLALNELSFKLNLKDNKMAVGARIDTSDLAQVIAFVQKQIAPQFQGEFLGAAVDVNWVDQGENKADAKAFFANFLPGKDEAGIKEAMGLPANASVTLDAPAADVALVAVAAPEITIDGKLAELQTDGKKLLASSPVDIAAGAATGSGSGSKNGLIAVGALLLLGVGGFIAFGSKKS